MSAPIRDQLLTTLSLSGAGYYPRAKLLDIACSHPGCEDREEVEHQLGELIRLGRVVHNHGLIYSVPTELELSEYFAGADHYRMQMARRNSLLGRLAALWRKIWGGVVLIIATSSLCAGLCAVEVPDQIIRGLVAVESGAEWIDTGEIKGRWHRGASGEVSHFQMSIAVLKDMRAPISRVERDTVLAESYARLWLSKCREKSGSWSEALARYNCGSRYKSAKAKDYAVRVLALAGELPKEVY